MNRYEEMFTNLEKKKEKALISFVVLGDPNEKQSEKIIQKLVDSGSDALELGLAFSDPIADGPTIQAADQRALEIGMNLAKAFEIISIVRKKNPSVPIGLLVYCNLVYNYGVERFYVKLGDVGVDSVLIADLSLEESDHYLEQAKKNKVKQIFIIAPTTTPERIEKITRKANGFIYLVAVAGITGARESVKGETIELLKKTREKTSLPLCVGFGVSKPEHIKALSEAGADGLIVGSAIVKLIEKNLENEQKMLEDIGNYAKKMKEATL